MSDAMSNMMHDAVSYLQTSRIRYCQCHVCTVSTAREHFLTIVCMANAIGRRARGELIEIRGGEGGESWA